MERNRAKKQGGQGLCKQQEDNRTFTFSMLVYLHQIHMQLAKIHWNFIFLDSGLLSFFVIFALTCFEFGQY